MNDFGLLFNPIIPSVFKLRNSPISPLVQPIGTAYDLKTILSLLLTLLLGCLLIILFLLLAVSK
jgi:hypothetical protein